MTGSLLGGGVFKSLTLITGEPLIGVDVRSLMVLYPGANTAPVVVLKDWMVLSS